MTRPYRRTIALAAFSMLATLSGCTEKKQIHQIGEKVQLGGVVYSVLDTEWLTGLDSGGTGARTYPFNVAAIDAAAVIAEVAEMTAEAVAEEEERLQAQWGKGFARIAGGSLLGTPDTVMDRLRAYINAGATDVNIALRAPWDAEALNVYLTEVVPAIKAEFG